MSLYLYSFHGHVIHTPFLAKCDYVWLYAMANPSVRLLRACTLLRGFNFSGIFFHHIVAWPSGNSPFKNHEDRPSDHS